jgi:hypothetical protein
MIESLIPRNVCETCAKTRTEGCSKGPKEHCEEYKSELQWQFEHYVTDEEKLRIKQKGEKHD